MKISKTTLAFLKNFSTINQSIIIKPGKKLETISNVRDVMASISVDEEFPIQAAIYDLNNFLSVVSLFEDPEFTFNDNCVVITGGNNTARFFFSEPGLITAPPEKEINFPEAELSFDLTKEDLGKILKAAAVCGAESIDFTNGNIVVSSTQNSFSFDGLVGTTGDYKLSISVEKLKLIQDDYKVEISSKGLSKFTGVSGTVYYIALTTNGYYNG